MKFSTWALAALIFCAGAVDMAERASSAEAAGSYTRPNGDQVKVAVVGGKLFCKIVAGSQTGFEMCHGMSQTGPDTWAGSEMKHPSMPGIMTFNGTVVVASGGLSIKGCAVGQSMCDSESWKRN